MILTKKKKVIKRPFREEKKDLLRINEDITAQKVRIVGEGIESKICSIEEALEIADSVGLDLVEILPNNDPPVCKIIDYSKYKYSQKRHQEKIKANTKQKVIKEIKLGPNMGDHDFDFKLRHAKTFLQEKSSLRIYIFFTGRMMKFKENGEMLLARFVEALKDVGTQEFEPKMEGKKLFTVVNPL